MSAGSRLRGYWQRVTGRSLPVRGDAAVRTDDRPLLEGEAPWSLPVDSPDGPVADRVLPHRVPVTDGVVSHLRRNRLPVRLFLRDQVLRLSIPREVSLGAQFAFHGIPTDAMAWNRLDERRHASLLPSLRPCDRFVGAGELLVKAKQFDDGLCAAVETASQEACGSFRGKRPLLRALLDHLSGGGRAASYLAAAGELGGVQRTRTAEAARVMREFLSNDLLSKPVGFYTWNDELGRIFRQDRLLQSDLQ